MTMSVQFINKRSEINMPSQPALPGSHVLHWSCWVWVSTLAPNLIFLPKRTLAGSSGGSCSWVSTPHMRVQLSFMLLNLVQSDPCCCRHLGSKQMLGICSPTRSPAFSFSLTCQRNKMQYTVWVQLLSQQEGKFGSINFSFYSCMNISLGFFSNL